MGGCCSSSQKFQLHGTPVYNYCPPALEEHESTTLRESSFSTRLLIDVNLDTSIPDTYRSPPTPIPFDVVLGIPQSTNMASDDQAYQKPTLVKVKIFDHVAEGNTPIVESPKKVEVGIQTSKSPDCSTMEEEDVCPTCFEEYDTENPRIVTKCNHQFHLSCILEWMERSNTCPICSQEMHFEAL
ncbi:putative transcription factor C2H2 family [Helianthus annuus]|nr:putative transcription factor C2H2 family [Helianthus annuus]